MPAAIKPASPMGPAGGFPCHVCQDGHAEALPAFTGLAQITSDCRPWKAGARLGVCRTCGVTQKATDAGWKADAKTIYDGYRMYPQGGGAEQVVFDQTTGAGIGRSRKLLDRVAEHVAFPASGRILDIGCGNGSLLRSFRELHPGWSMAGTETHDTYRSEIEAIAGVRALHVTECARVPGAFDLIVMVHVLEHIVQPVEFLRDLLSKLNAGGQLLIQVPYYNDNPFDLVIADHCSHFTPDSLSALLRASGYRITHGSETWVPRELTAMATPQDAAAPSAAPGLPADPAKDATNAVAWLSRVSETVRAFADKGPVAVFGTSIAATWIFGELEGSVAFFVDEDEARIGNTHLDRPVLSPDEAPNDVPVILAQAGSLGTALTERLNGAGLTLLTPPCSPHT